MSSKQQILEAIQRNKPAKTVLPELLSFTTTDNLFKKYTQAVTLNGGTAIGVETYEEIDSYIKENFLEGVEVVSLIQQISGNRDIQTIVEPHDLEKVEVAVVKGVLGVAENAAVWIPEKNLPHRVLPFIAQHLILVVDKNTLVPNMHEAYQKIQVAEDGYGVFIAGPSKTADIEQSLVIGAHGPRSLTVFLMG
jgi:L-lactate dehydrogenase complex protein LldG